MRPALGSEATVHHGECTLGVGTLDRSGKREVRAEPVITHPVVELDTHSEEAFAGAQFENGAELDRDRVVTSLRARPLVADRMRRQPVRRRLRDPGAHRARLLDRDRHRLRAIDDRVGRGWAVVVGVAPVAAVDEAVGAAHVHAIGVDRERTVGGIDFHAQVLVGEHRPVRPHFRAWSSAFDDAKRAPPETRYLTRREQNLLYRRTNLPDRDGLPGYAHARARLRASPRDRSPSHPGRHRGR